MRYEIVFEDAWEYEWFILKGALIFPVEGVPITWAHDHMSLPLGKARDFQREEDGSITGEFKFFEKDRRVENLDAMLENYEVRPAFWANEVVREMHDGICEVHRASVKAIGLVPVLDKPIPTKEMNV